MSYVDREKYDTPAQIFETIEFYPKPEYRNSENTPFGHLRDEVKEN
jgi:hypothetical protein